MGLLHELTDTHPQAMKRLRELREMPVERAGPGLTELLGHSAHEVRVDAARALGRSRWEPAVPRLIECLGDRHPHVVAWAAEALGRIGNHEAVQPLEAVLSHEKDVPRIYAAQALRRISHRSAVSALIRALHDPSYAVFTEAKDALEALIQPEDRRPLEQAAYRLSRLRRWKLRGVFAKLAERKAAAI